MAAGDTSVVKWSLFERSGDRAGMGLDILLPHLIMSEFEFVDELGGWF